MAEETTIEAFANSRSADEQTESEEDAKVLTSTLAKRRKRRQKELANTLQDSQEDYRQASLEITTLKPTASVIGEEEEEGADDERAKPRPQTKKTTTPDDVGDGKTDAATPGPSAKLAEKASGSALNASIRERLKKKVATAKMSAHKIVEEEVRPSRRLRELRDQPITTRFDDPEEAERDRQIAESIASKSRWKEAIAETKKALKLPTEDEAYDFFTKTFEAEAEDEGEKPEDSGTAAEATTEGVEEKADVEASEKTPLFFDETDIIVYERADYVPFHTRLEKERILYFSPTMLTSDPSSKIAEGAQPRYVEEEGIYVGERPPVALRNQNRIENRLIKSPGSRQMWFGEDGCLIALPDPLKIFPSKPEICEPEELDPALQYDYHKAVLTDFDSRFIDGMGNVYGQYQLDVDVSSLTFTHHPLFSMEHVLATKLSQLYDQYIHRYHRSMSSFLTNKLQALKDALSHLRQHLAQTSESLTPESLREQNYRLAEYKREIHQTRSQRDSEDHTDRSLLKHIIKTWKDMKRLRDGQQYTNTPIKLILRREETDADEDKLSWNREIETELQECRENYEDVYEQASNKYHTAMEEWKKQVKEMKKTRRKKLKSTRRGSQEQLDQSFNDVGGEENEPMKPEEPESFNETQVRKDIRDKALHCRRRPGEPILVPELSSAATVTPTQLCPSKEQNRRNAIPGYKVFAKVLFNDKEVCRTHTRSLTSEFNMHFGNLLNIQIVQWPETIKIQIFNATGLSSDLLAEIYLPIPDGAIHGKNVKMTEMDFSSDQRINYTHTGVGSGVILRCGIDGHDEVSVMTSGKLTCGVAWGTSADGNPLVPPVTHHARGITAISAMKKADPLAALGAAGAVDMEKLAQWLSEIKLDPNDPTNASLIHLIKSVSGSKKIISDYFRLEQMQEEFNFATDEDLKNNKRFKLIEMRESEIPEFKSYKMIPIKEQEIPDTVFIQYEQKKLQEEREQMSEEVDEHRRAVSQFRTKVRDTVMVRFIQAQHYYTLQDVVIEDTIPDISMLGTTFVKIFEPRRPLRPTRRERKTVTAQNISGSDVNVLVNIGRAFNLPQRKEQASSPAGGKGLSSDLYPVSVCPMVEASFQRVDRHTSVADGTCPNWNEELVLPFRAPNNDYSPTSLQTVDDILYLNVFDEVVIDILQDDRQRSTNVHQRIERRWLGSIKIPFSTIYFNGRVDGTFMLNTPPVLLGYTYPAGPLQTDIDTTPTAAGGQNKNNSSYLSLFLTIEPPLAPPEAVNEKFESKEDESLVHNAEIWQAALEKQFPKRQFRTTVIDINGQSVFVTRYFKALKPPDDVVEAGGSLTKEEKLSRFVSMIPFVSDNVAFPGVCDIWSTCDQFLQLLAGDEEEHAVLLCNYFLHLGKKSWVVIGSAIPEGATAYVLTQESVYDYWIWNPSTGNHFNRTDIMCPLKSIGCLINQDNIWANIQANDEPCRMDFDITKATAWRPFFSKKYHNPGLATVQPASLVYFPTDRISVSELQDKIEKKLREKVMEWRPRFVTRWNRYCTQTFRQLLPQLELNSGKRTSDEHCLELERTLGSYKISGYPIQMQFVEINDVIEAVYSTGVFKNENPDVEFALAVYIHAYPNTVQSLWVYIASLIRAR